MRNDKLHEIKKKIEYNKKPRTTTGDVKIWFQREGEFSDKGHRRLFWKTYSASNAQRTRSNHGLDQ